MARAVFSVCGNNARLLYSHALRALRKHGDTLESVYTEVLASMTAGFSKRLYDILGRKPAVEEKIAQTALQMLIQGNVNKNCRNTRRLKVIEAPESEMITRIITEARGTVMRSDQLSGVACAHHGR